MDWGCKEETNVVLTVNVRVTLKELEIACEHLRYAVEARPDSPFLVMLRKNVLEAYQQLT